MTDARLRVLRPLLDRIIPADDFSSATQAQVDTYVLRLLDTDLAYKRNTIEAGLDNLEAEARAQFNAPFADLAPDQQDQLLKTLEAGTVKTAWQTDAKSWFNDMIALAMEGFYSDPGNGGNKNEVSWKMIGYDPGAARHA